MKTAVVGASSISVNLDAALYRTAQERGLGEAKTDEMTFGVSGHLYIAQGFTHNILYAEVGGGHDIRQTHW